MKKIVINTCYGGFNLSDAAIALYSEYKGIKLVGKKDLEWWMIHYYIDGIEDDEHYYDPNKIPRDDPHLVAVIAELGDGADGEHSKLKIVEIPDDVLWEVDEYDGMEHIQEKHRTWR